MSGILSGLKVLDLSWGVAGPITTMLMVDHGANVTKIEPPGGDPFRHLLAYKAWQRNKRSAVFDLKDARDNALFLKLARDADVLVESYSPGTAERLGIGYATLAALNPRLVYCSITGYGDLPGHADRPAYDALVAARLGLQYEHRGWPEGALNHLAGLPDPFEAVEIPLEWRQGPPREGPLFSAVPYPSMGAAYSASLGIAAALYERERSGLGQLVETSLAQGAFASAIGVWQRAEDIDAEMFNTWILGSKAPKGHYECSDGRWIHNWVPNPRFILTASAGDTLDATPDLSVQNDPDRFGTGPEEIVAMSYYQPILAEAMKRFPAQAWVDAAGKAGVTMQEARSPEEALTDPLLVADRCSFEVDDPDLGVIREVGISYTLTSSPGKDAGLAPTLDQHGAVLRAEAVRAPDAPADAAAPRPRGGTGPLAGIRVLDLGLAIAGPFGTQLLSDLGAEVIKVNALYDTYWHRNHVAYVANRGKRSIALNLKDPRAMQILKELVQSADVVQHNMRYDAAERLKVDYESLKAIKPDLIYCHTRGHEHGPRQALPGNDQTGGCLAGVQYEDGAMAAGGKPLWAFTSFGDTGNGFLSAIGICQALRHRERTGEGQRVDTSIVNAQMLNCSYAIAKADGGRLDRPQLDRMQTGLMAGYGLYECADGWLCVAALEQEHLSALADATGIADLGSRDDQTARAALAERLRGASSKHWFARLDAAGVPCEISDPAASLRMHDDPELLKRQWIASYRHPFVGKLDQIGLQVQLSATPASVQGPPLVVGDETREILAELGRSPEEIETLLDGGVAMGWREGETHRVFASRWAAAPTAPPARPAGAADGAAETLRKDALAG